MQYPLKYSILTSAPRSPLRLSGKAVLAALCIYLLAASPLRLNAAENQGASLEMFFGMHSGEQVNRLTSGFNDRDHFGLNLDYLNRLASSTGSFLYNLLFSAGVEGSLAQAYNSSNGCVSSAGQVFYTVVMLVAIIADDNKNSSSYNNMNSPASCSGSSKTYLAQAALPVGLQYRQGGGLLLEVGTYALHAERWNGCSTNGGCADSLSGPDGSFYARLGAGFYGQSGGGDFFVQYKRFYNGQFLGREASALDSFQFGFSGSLLF